MAVPVLAGLTACGEDYADYTAAPKDGSASGSASYSVKGKVVFPDYVTSVAKYELTDDETSFDFLVERDFTDMDSARTAEFMDTTLVVRFKVSQIPDTLHPDALLDIPDSVVIPAGEEYAYITVGYDPEKMRRAKTNVTLEIVEDDLYGTASFGSSYSFVATLPTMTDWHTKADEFAADGGVGQFPLSVSNKGTYHFASAGSFDQKAMLVSFRQNKDDANLGQFKLEKWGAGFLTRSGIDVVLDAEWDEKANYYRISIPETNAGYFAESYGEYMMFSDQANWRGKTWEDFPSYFDPATGEFILNTAYYISLGAFGYGEEILQLDGFAKYEADLDEDFDWETVFKGDFKSERLGSKYAAELQKGICVTTTDACDSVFAAKYGTAYKIIAPYSPYYDLIFCVDENGVINLPAGYTMQPTGLNALNEMVYAKINGGSFDENDIILNITFTNYDRTVDFGTTDEELSYIPRIPVYNGTFYYNFFSESETELTPVDDLMMSMREEDGLYMIEGWITGINFLFSWDTETNECSVENQYSGYTHSQYGAVNMIEGAIYGSAIDTGDEDFTKLKSYYDPATKLFHFYPVYYVSAGWFGQFEEIYQVTGDAVAGVKAGIRAKAPIKLKKVAKFTKNTAYWNKLWQGKKVNRLVLDKKSLKK